MAAPLEVLISTEQTGQVWSACVWNMQSGSSMITFKGASAAPRSLNVLSSDYLVSAQALKPVLQFWTLNKREQMHSRMVCPGQVTALTFTPDAAFCIAAVAEKIHVWQVATGNLLAVLSRHYQNVTCVKTTQDGSYFISAGDDNLIMVWNLHSVVTSSIDRQQTHVEPKYSWSKHSLPVTDVLVGCGNAMARVFSVSLDQTCKVWDLSTGELLCTFVFDVGLCSITSGAAERHLYVGGYTGDIYQVSLFEKPAMVEKHISKSSTAPVFQGHTQQVTCLCTTMDARTLVSGSHDSTVRLWDVHSRQCLKVFSHKGAITNLLVIPTPSGIMASDDKFTEMPLLPLKRHLLSDSTETGRALTEVKNKARPTRTENISNEDILKALKQAGGGKRIADACELQTVKAINKELYQYTVAQLFDTKT